MTDRKTRVRWVVMRVVAGIGLLIMGIGMVWVGQTAGADRIGLVLVFVGVAVIVLAVPFSGIGQNRPPHDTPDTRQP